MGSPFDSLRQRVFDACKARMGYEASWTPSAGGATQTATVLFNRPTNDRKQFGVEFNPYIFTMEYLEGDFVGLIEAARESTVEFVKLDGQQYQVQEVNAFWDGQTHRAQLQLVV